MKTFRITPEAKEWVLRILDQAVSTRRVAHFIEIADAGPASQKLKKAYSDGVPLQVIRQLEIESLPHDLGDRLRLTVAVYNDMWYMPWDLVRIDGIRFFLPLRLRLRVGNGLLEKAEKGLALMDVNGEVVLPRKAPTAKP